MRAINRGCLVVVCVLLSGCGSVISWINASSSDLVSAGQLNIDQNKLADAEKCVSPAGVTCRKNFVASVALQSIMQCQKFANQLVITENTVNTAGDITSTIFTALGTVFTPLTTVHAMTAGATIVSGSKSAVNANIYAKASISSLQAALDKVYTQPMLNYLTYLKNVTDDSKIDVGTEVVNVQMLHGNCALAEAEIFVNGTVNSAPPQPLNLVPGVVPASAASAVPAASAVAAATGG
ncbi:hypothetical protein FAZ69_16610 [Trinickia terrae]|uniref:Lipoprotein n=1 Tax=Trinickia terrae TaxID=2571161 RepID=A0A4U1I3R4_9BURK|nr:hypothetical protein [Trinickia terrae]TKC87889.1 hypothetical protein FAZ69_16610 [Trinickia terrae]